MKKTFSRGQLALPRPCALIRAYDALGTEEMNTRNIRQKQVTRRNDEKARL